MSFRLIFISLALLVAVPAGAQTWQTVRVVEPRTGKIFLEENPHLALTGGSTTKAMTMHLVLKAIQLGKIKLSDTLTISAASVTYNCTCWANSLLGQSGQVHNLKGGEKFSVDDALYGVDESAVEPTVSVAEFLANAWLKGVKATSGNNTALSQQLLQEFIGLMNQEAALLGMSDTHYTTVFGGTAETTSAIDMIELWTTSTADPQFLRHTGFRSHSGTIHVQKQGGGYVQQKYTVGKAYTYFPNVDGDKNGGFGNICCFESQATRGGRTIVAALLGSTTGFADIGLALETGFEDLFLPTRWVVREFGPASTRVAVSSASAMRAVTVQAYVDGRAGLIVWNDNVTNANMTEVGASYSQVQSVSDIAVANVRNNFAATVFSSNGTIVLTGWNINPNGVPTETAPTYLGTGSEPRVVTIGPGIFAVSYLSSAGTPHVGLYSIGASSPAQISMQGQIDATFAANEIDIAGGPTTIGGSDTQVVLAARKSAGGTRLVVYKTSTQLGQIGLTKQSEHDEADLFGISLGRTFFYSTSYRLAGVVPATTRARILFFTTAKDVVSDVGSTDYASEAATATRVAGLGGSDLSAALFTLDSSGYVRVSAHDIDIIDAAAPPPAALNLLSWNFPVERGHSLAVTPVNDGGSAGTYIVADVGPDQLVHLVMYRLGWR